MNKILFSDGSKVSSAKVTIDSTDYPVTPARYNGATPLSSTILNTMQDNIEDAIDQNADNIGGEEYDNTETYAVGDIVKYNGQLYICNTDIVTPEEFDNTKWDETDVLSSAGGNEIAIGSVSDITGKTKIFIDESTQALKYKDSTTGQFTDIAGDEVFIGDEQDAPEDTKIIIDDEGQPLFSSEVVNSLSGNETAKAPSVRAVKEDLIESGSNANGSYIKFPDGTLICRTNTAPSGSWIGSCYRAVWTFPYSFIDTNYTITGNALSGNQKAYTVSFGSKNTNNVTIDTKCLGVNGENETCDRSAECITIGKWK